MDWILARRERGLVRRGRVRWASRELFPLWWRNHQGVRLHQLEFPVVRLVHVNSWIFFLLSAMEKCLTGDVSYRPRTGSLDSALMASASV